MPGNPNRHRSGEDAAPRSLGYARSAAARLVAVGKVDGDVNLDELAARGPAARAAALAAAAVDDYLGRNPNERQRVEGALARLERKVENDPSAPIRSLEELRAQLVSLAVIDAATREAPAAAARLRADLTDYLATIEGLTVPRPGP